MRLVQAESGQRVDVAALATRLAQVLRGLGVGPGHVVAAATGNTPLHVALHLAARAVPCDLAPMPPTVPADGLARRTAESAVDVVVADGLASETTLPTVRLAPDGELVVSGGRVAARAPPSEPAGVWVRTSGTTGTPRPVRLTQTMLAAHARAASLRLESGPDATWLGVLPLRHVGGVALVDRCIRDGSTLVLAQRFDAAGVQRALRDHNVTHVSLVPTMLHRLLEVNAAPPPTLRCVLLGGDVAGEDLVRTAVHAGWPVWCTYGLTEACSQVATASPEERLANPGSNGTPLAGVEVACVAGELVVRGPSVVGGGPLATGDLGFVDTAGHVHVTGRVRDIIVTGGEKVVASDVERVLEQHPAVVEACVVGLADAQWGARVGAAVVLRHAATEEELRAWCRARLPAPMVPKEVRRVDVLPRTESGKLQRALVRTRWDQRTTPT